MPSAHDETSSLVLIELTPAAVAHIKRAMERESLRDHGLRVSVVTGGCSGNEYALSFVETPSTGDTVYTFDGVRVFVDTESAQKLRGTVLDYVNSLSGGGLRFKNPNATHQCGCGTSFATE
jgi:iron-sulfur cluster assembly accessory protein